MTNSELLELLREAFDGGVIYGAESVRYGVDAVAYNWKHWLDRHDVTSYVDTDGKEQTSDMQIRFNPFDMGTSEDKARKVCEEAMEFYAEHHECWSYGLTGNGRKALFYEIGDVLTAILNYCAAERIDPQQCIDRVERKNRNRGRYGNEH